MTQGQPVPNNEKTITAPPFRFSQASQLFINVCFALSLSGVFWLIAAALDVGASPPRYHNLLFVLLDIYIIFLIWRQYSSYYIPVQYYRDHEEADGHEFTTFLITIVLALYPIVCVFWRSYSLLVLLFLILLNLLKVGQMRKCLPESGRSAVYAMAVLNEFSKRLQFYAITVVFLNLPLHFFRTFINSEWVASLLYGVAPLLLFRAAKQFRDIYFAPEFDLSAWKFHACIFSIAHGSLPEDGSPATN